MNHFATLSLESLKNEIELTKKRISITNSQQDKLMLFAMESELVKRTSGEGFSATDKFKAFTKKVDELYSLFNEFDVDNVAGEAVLGEGVLCKERLESITTKLSHGIANAKQVR